VTLLSQVSWAGTSNKLKEQDPFSLGIVGYRCPRHVSPKDSHKPRIAFRNVAVLPAGSQGTATSATPRNLLETQIPRGPIPDLLSQKPWGWA
jgi:hypothetical protein